MNEGRGSASGAKGHGETAHDHYIVAQAMTGARMGQQSIRRIATVILVVIVAMVAFRAFGAPL